MKFMIRMGPNDTWSKLIYELTQVMILYKVDSGLRYTKNDYGPNSKFGNHT